MLNYLLQRLATIIPDAVLRLGLIFGLQQLLPATRRSRSPARTAIRT